MSKLFIYALCFWLVSCTGAGNRCGDQNRCGIMSIKEQYWKYSLIVIILGLGIVIFREFIPFLNGILGAFTIYVLLRGQMRYLLIKKRWKRPLAAALLLLEAILLFLVPLGLITWLIVSEIQNIDIDFPALMENVGRWCADIERKAGYNLLDEENLNSMVSAVPVIGQKIMGGVTNLVINAFILLFLLYFMLTGGQKMEKYFSEIFPFNRKNTRAILCEVDLIVKSNAIGIPLLAIIQGGIAVLGYWMFGISNLALWGILTAFTAIIPIIGTGIVWIPLAFYMGFFGHWGHAVGLTAYCLLVVGNVDNLVRFLLQKRLADTHPLITIFGVVIGLGLFGFLGVIFGPLLLALFILCLNIFKNEYLEQKYMGRSLLNSSGERLSQ